MTYFLRKLYPYACSADAIINYAHENNLVVTFTRVNNSIIAILADKEIAMNDYISLREKHETHSYTFTPSGFPTKKIVEVNNRYRVSPMSSKSLHGMFDVYRATYNGW